jgi:hypothetical protein
VKRIDDRLERGVATLLKRAVETHQHRLGIRPAITSVAETVLADHHRRADRDRALRLCVTDTEWHLSSDLIIAMHHLVVFVPKVFYASIHQQPFPGWKLNRAFL